MPPPPAQDLPLVGTWELARFDNLEARNLPPWGLQNYRYAFYPDGRAEMAAPGQPFEALPVYSLAGDVFTGTLRLTNGDAPKQLTWADDTTLRVAFQDESTATLHKLSDDPGQAAEPGFPCVPLTIKGRFDAQYVTALQETLRGPGGSEDLRSSLMNTWRVELGPTDAILIGFREDDTYDKAREPGGGRTSTREKYAYRLHSDVLRMQTETGCSEQRIRFAGSDLQLTGDGQQWATLKSASKEAADALAALLPPSAKLIVGPLGTRMGSETLTDEELESAARALLARDPETPFQISVWKGAAPGAPEEVKAVLEEAGVKRVELRGHGQ